MINLSVRELEERDIEPITNYWLNSPPEYLEAMGADLAKMPKRNEWLQFLSEQLTRNYQDKTSYALIWEMDGTPIGHSNINKIIFGVEAYIHLHIWEDENRKKGLGTTFLEMTIPHFFNNLKLKKLYCETYILNPSPNKTLANTGFKPVKEYVTTPGWINFEQRVKLWELGLEDLIEVL